MEKGTTDENWAELMLEWKMLEGKNWAAQWMKLWVEGEN